MADNRLYLVHRPSLVGISIGKRYGWGWSAVAPPEEVGERIRRLYRQVEEVGDAWPLQGTQDDFVVVDEQSGKFLPSGQGHEVDGLMRFEPRFAETRQLQMVSREGIEGLFGGFVTLTESLQEEVAEKVRESFDSMEYHVTHPEPESVEEVGRIVVGLSIETDVSGPLHEMVIGENDAEVRTVEFHYADHESNQ
jgi:hypothetical protein